MATTPRRSNAERSQATRTALVGHARTLFVERGYEHVSQGEIVTVAGVTRGALYHHFTDKRDLFRAVFEEMEAEVTEEIAASVRDVPERMHRMVTALSAFLDVCQRPDVRQVMLTDAPAVLGWQTWREIEEQYGLGFIESELLGAEEEGVLVPVVVPVLARLVLSAATEAALVIAHSEDHEAARVESEQALLALLRGAARTSDLGQPFRRAM